MKVLKESLMTRLRATSMRYLISFSFVLFVSLFLTNSFASAHEVYLYDAATIERLASEPSISLFTIALDNLPQTLLWGVIVGFIIISVFIISISATFEDKFDKHLVKLKKYAPFISRVTIGLAFMYCAYHKALFGPELPFSEMFGRFTDLMQMVFYVMGAALLFGIYSRVVGIIGLLIFVVAIFFNGIYMVTYVHYLAEFLVLLLIGGHKFSVAHEHTHWWSIKDGLDYLSNRFGEFAFLFLRIGFGTALIYSAVYAKIMHNQLALAVVNDFNLVHVFGLPAEFIVLGAAIVEILLGVMFIFGIEIRFNAVVINIFLTLSLLYFGEAVWPHIMLVGIPIAFFFYGYDKYSLEGYFFKKGNREPIF